MAARACLCLAVMLACRSLTPEIPRALTVWNVGQGQWVTFFDEAGCWHFDIGGEFAPWRAIKRLCRSQANFVWLSHWDWDHVSFARAARIHLPELCFLGRPGGAASNRKSLALDGASECMGRVSFPFWAGAAQGAANEMSRVALIGGILIPGDSTRTQEKVWMHLLPVVQARILVLGHHGSRTSTSKALAAKLEHTVLAIASARARRYGHPHREVLKRMRERKIPVLRTEDWGSIRIFM